MSFIKKNFSYSTAYRFYMINFSILISSSEVSGPGGLFDIDATYLSNSISIINGYLKYIQPLLTIIEERKEYILTNLGKASEILSSQTNNAI
jgi:hypothetical protein